MTGGKLLTAVMLLMLALGSPPTTQPSSPTPPKEPAPQAGAESRFQGGVCWVGSTDEPALAYLAKNGVGWLSVTPFGYGHKDPHVPPEGGYRHSTYPGESIEGVRRVIQRAHRSGLKVMLKPHVWFATKTSWRGEIEMKSDEDWATWFRMYREFLDPFIAMAKSEKVEIFCIATELNGTVAREKEWRALIASIRERYSGQLTYGANWFEEFERIAFWDALDAIGVQAYFPLTKKQLPTVEEIAAAWKPWTDRMAAVAKREKRPILLTEFGYKPVVGTTIEPWKWRADGVDHSPKAQLDAYEAAFRVLDQASWCDGVYIWKWYRGWAGGKKRHSSGHDSFSPQGLPAEQAMFRWFRKKGGGVVAEREAKKREPEKPVR